MKKQLAIVALLGFSLVNAQSSNPTGDRVSYIAQVQAALEASLWLHTQGDVENAKRQIGGASGKRWDRVRADLNVNDRQTFEAGFKALNASIDAKESTEKYKALVESLDDKLGALIGKNLEPQNAGTALDRLLIDTAFYYNRGVEGSKVVAPRTYAFASALAPESIELAEKAGLGADAKTALERLEQRIKAVANSGEIQELATQARAAVGKASGVNPALLEHQFFLDRTRNGLKKVDGEYTTGKTDQAIKTLAELYLDGFEYLEDPISAKSPELKEALEKQIGGAIPQAIKANKPANEISPMIAEGMTGLEKAAALLGLK